MAFPSDERRFSRQADADAARIIELLVEISAKLGADSEKPSSSELPPIQQTPVRRGRRKKPSE
nr:hypothetical protein [uncultured Mediterranean phage uvMED]